MERPSRAVWRTESDLVRVGALLVVLPMVSALTVLQSRRPLSCSRRLDAPRVPVGQSATVTTRVENVSRRRTGVLLAEDVISCAAVSQPRFVLDEIEPGAHRELSHQIRADTRGKFTIGPLRVRLADTFGLVEMGRAFGTSSTLLVTPRIFPLPRVTAPGSRLGQGDGGIATNSAIGEDDAGPRTYRHGDGLHRVHWKSTARYGELMVRGEERQCRNSASVFLDTRRSAHSGAGPTGTFEFAVSAAASICAHLSSEGLLATFITGAGDIAPSGGGPGQDTLLDKLAVISPSHEDSLRLRAPVLAGLPLLVLSTVPAMMRRAAEGHRGGRDGVDFGSVRCHCPHAGPPCA